MACHLGDQQEDRGTGRMEGHRQGHCRLLRGGQSGGALRSDGAQMELIEKVLDGGTISLTCGEQNEPGRRMRVQAGSCLLPHLGTEALSRGTGSSNPFPYSAESATNLVAAGGVARGWDSEFESALLQRRVSRDRDNAPAVWSAPSLGQDHTCTRRAARTLYPKLLEFRELARSYDPGGKFRNEFLDVHVFG